MKHILLLILLGICGLLRGQSPVQATPPVADMQYARNNESVLVLKPNQPNPFSEQTRIRFQLNKPENVTITLYNILGAKMFTLLEEELEIGDHNYIFRRPADLPDGLYIYTVETPTVSRSQRMIIRR